MKKKRNNNHPKSWLLAALAILMAVLFIFSRGERAARRAKLPAPQKVEAQQTSLETKTQEDMEPQIPEITEPITLELLLGKVDPASNPKFVAVKTKYASRSGMYMHREAYEAFVKMHEAARIDGINLMVVSAMRTFNHQRRIWNNKWNGLQVLEGNVNATSIAEPVERAREILRFSAMPGTSRHHWGTDIDLNSLVNSYFESGQGKRVHDWLQQNATHYGFCQPYTTHGANRNGGYEEEKWHWSYMPVSENYLQAFKESVGYEHITGFDGWETAREIDVIKTYVLEINQDCKNK